MSNNIHKINSFIHDSDDKLNKIISGLQEISKLAEIQFSRISENLQYYYNTTKEISNESFSVAELFSDEDYSNKINRLKNISEKIFSSVSSNTDKFEGSSDRLNNIIELIDKTNNEVSSFSRLVKYLRVQGMSIKIESARLGSNDEGFGNLAENVNNLSGVISEKSKKFNSEAKTLLNTINDVKINTTKLDGFQKEHRAAILRNTSESLNSVDQKYGMSAEKSGLLSNHFEEVRKKIGEIVTSVQFHDITRQQMENICGTLTKLRERLTQMIAEEEIGNKEKIYTIVFEVCKVQKAQLDNSKSELNNAVYNIISNLESVGTDILDMATDASKLLENDGDSYTPFIENIKNGLSNVLKSLTANEDVTSELTSSVNSVMNTLTDLTSFVNEIDEIGSEIELISLNANVKATHLGIHGAGLSVLANEIQKLSLDAKRRTDGVVNLLNRVNKLSDDLQAQIEFDSNSDKMEELKTIRNDINNIFESINLIIKNGMKKLGKIHKMTLDLNNRIRDLTGSITLHNELTDRIGILFGLFENILTAGEPYVDESFLNDPEMKSIIKEYTMKKQRDVHKSVSSRTDDQEINFEEINNNHGNDDLGDNVELF